MGQSASIEEASNETRHFINNFQVVKKYNDKRFGEVQLLEEKAVGTKFLQKDFTSHSVKDHQEYLKECKARVGFNHPNIVKILGYSSKKESGFCGEFYKVSFYFACCDHDLEAEIQKRAQAKDAFDESELWYILDSCVSGGAFYEINNAQIGDIKPCNILVTPTQEYQIIDHGIFGKRTLSNNIGLVQGMETTSQYIAPEIFKAIKTNKKVTSSPYKADIFSLGMSILEAALLENLGKCYNWDKFTFDEGVLAQALLKLREKYSERFVRVVEQMVSMNEEVRLNFINLDAILNPWRMEIRGRKKVIVITETIRQEPRKVVEVVKSHVAPPRQEVRAEVRTEYVPQQQYYQSYQPQVVVEQYQPQYQTRVVEQAKSSIPVQHTTQYVEQPRYEQTYVTPTYQTNTYETYTPTTYHENRTVEHVKSSGIDHRVQSYQPTVETRVDYTPSYTQTYDYNPVVTTQSYNTQSYTPVVTTQSRTVEHAKSSGLPVEHRAEVRAETRVIENQNTYVEGGYTQYNQGVTYSQAPVTTYSNSTYTQAPITTYSNVEYTQPQSYNYTNVVENVNVHHRGGEVEKKSGVTRAHESTVIQGGASIQYNSPQFSTTTYENSRNYMPQQGYSTTTYENSTNYVPQGGYSTTTYQGQNFGTNAVSQLIDSGSFTQQNGGYTQEVKTTEVILNNGGNVEIVVEEKERRSEKSQ